MLKRRLLNLRKLWLSLLLMVGATAIAVPGIQEVMEGNVAKIGDTEYETLQSALEAAQDGDIVTLLQDIDATTFTKVANYYNFTINKSITFDGNGHSITVNSRGIAVNQDGTSTVNVTFKNLTVNNAANAGRAISTRGNIGKVVLDNVKINCTGSGNTQGFTVGGNQSTAQEIEIVNGSEINVGYSGYCIITFNPVTLDIKDSTLDGWASIYAKGVDSSAGSAGSVISINNSSLVSVNPHSGNRNSFGVIQIEDDNVKVEITKSKVNISNTGDQTQAIAGFPEYNQFKSNSVLLGEGNTVEFSNTGSGSCSFVSNLNSNSFSITEGNFNADPSLYLAEGYKAVENNGTWTVQEITYVAQIEGGAKYETLADAFAAANDGETITLLDNVTLSGNLELALEGKSVTFDLGGNTLNGRTNLKSGSLTIQNGKIVATGDTQALNVYGSDNPAAVNYSVLTIASSVIVDAEMFGVCLFGKTATTAGYGAVVNIAGEVKTVGTGKEGTVFVSGNLGQNIAGDMKNVINITGKVTSTNDAAIALNGNATVNVNSGAVITGNTGIAVKRGVLNVEEGSTVHAKGEANLTPGANNNGTEMTGAAISMTDTYNNYGAMSVNITGGTFISDNTVALFKKEANYTNDATYSVSGGTFSTAVPAEFCAPGYEPKDLGNGQYSVYAPTYEVAIKSVTPKAESWYISGNANIQFVITKDGQAIATKLLNQEQLDKWDIILDENYLTLKSKDAAAKWLQYNFNVVGAGTTTIVFQNKANPEIKVEQEVSISHKLILTILPAGTHMVEAGPVEIATNTKFDGVAIENFEDYTFTSSDESIATISGTTITPLKAGTITVTATKNDDQTASASANVTFVDAPAKIGEVYYESIGKAMEAAQSGETITLLRDVTESYSFTGNQPRTNDFALTIDLNGHTWSGKSSPSYALRVDYGTITVKDSQGGGGVKYGSDYAFIVSHLASEYPSKLILENGTFTGKTSVAQVGYPGGSGSNKKYYGGDLVINGGTFVTVPDEGETYDENGNFKYTLNMLDMAESSYPGGIYSRSTIAVNGGKFLKFDPQNNLAEGANTNFVPEGLVSTKSVEDGEAWYTISKIVAKIGETTYTSLADAFTAATDGQTITVLTDIDLPSTIAVTKQVTLDLDGKKIFNTSDLWVDGNWSFFSVQAGGNLTVTGNGTIDAKENDCYSFDVREGGILTIKNGTFTGNISSVYLINEAGTGVSTCNIEGGTFSIKQLANVQDDKYRFLLNCYDASYASNTVKFNVTGGSFVNFNPANNQAEGAETNFCAPGYEAVQDGNVWTVQKAAVAQIEGGAKYETLQAAINACEAGTETTIKLLDNVTDGAGFAIPDGVTNKNIIIDFDGKSYNVTKDAVGSGNTKSQAMHFYSGNTLTLKNGTITSAATSEENKLKMMMQNYCDLTLDGMTIDCSNTNGGTYPDYSGTTYEYWSFKSVPVFNFNTGNATIKNTTITFRDGDNVGLCVDGGTVALGEGVEVNGPVSAVTGTVTITDGKYSGAITADKATIQISGGIFTKKPADEYCAHGFVVTDNKDEETMVQYPYTVMSKEDAGIFELIDRGNDPTTTPYTRTETVHAQQVTYIRKFSNTNYAPWYVPFDMEITDELASKFTFYKPDMVKGVVDEHGVTTNKDNYLQITEKGVGYVLKANKPYFVKAKQTGEFTFTVTDVDLEPAVTDPGVDCSTTTTTFKFNGNYDFYHNQGNFLLMRNNELQWSNNKYGVYTFRWYVTTVGKENWAKINLMIVENDSEATGVSSVDEVFSDEIEGYYTPNGSKHESPVKGMNIIKFKNGKTKKIMKN